MNDVEEPEMKSIWLLLFAVDTTGMTHLTIVTMVEVSALLVAGYYK